MRHHSAVMVQPNGREPLFGISVTPLAAEHPRLVEQVLAAERHGLDLVGIQDHPYQRRFLDTFALIADLLARTRRLRLFPDVANLPLRGPTMIAKAAASLDVMSGGRFELGLGAGAFWDAVAGMGGPHRGAGESIDALEEAIHIARAALDGERVVRSPGPHYPVPGYPPGPPPAHRVELWLGVYRPRGLDMVGRLADGWVPSMGRAPLADLRRAWGLIEASALRAGRDPATIRRIYNISGSIADGSSASAGAEGERTGRRSVQEWVELLAGWRDDPGIDGFIFWPPDSGTEQVERFAMDVVPAVRAAISATGATGATGT
jgi:alkanesulfonate monooxygenase SsuD/methylene tetrahydromethanopterin reductase-like flavin-dependent oxidoreductase (luciferase family)